MRICIIDRAAGFEQIPLRLAALKRLGHQVDFIYSPWPQQHIRPYGLYLRPLAALNRWQAGHLLNKLFFAIWALARLCWRHRRLPYDVVHIEEPLAALFALLLPRRLRPPVVFSTMGPAPAPARLAALSPEERLKLLDKTLALPAYLGVPARAILSFNLRRASRVVVNSDALRVALATLFPSNGANIDVVHAGADTRRFRPGVDGSWLRHLYGIGEGSLLLSMGPVQPRKGQLKLLQALPRLVQSHPDLTLLIVGYVLSPPYERSLQEFVARHGLEGHVVFAGQVTPRQLPAYYAAADLFVLLSSAEGGVPEALLEAMSAGKACVASDLPNNRVAAPAGDEVLFVDPDDSAAVAEAIGGLLAHPQRREEMGGKARHTVLRHFQWDVLAQQLVRVYERALDAGASISPSGDGHQRAEAPQPKVESSPGGER